MKKKILCMLASVLCVCFLFAGCGLIENQNEVISPDAAAITVGNTTITRGDIESALDTYFESYYNSYNTEAFNKLVEDLITEKLLLNEANRLVENGDIVLTATEKNYMWDQTFDAILSNLEKFEKDAEKLLNIHIESETTTTTTEEEGDSQYVYTEYSPTARVVLDEETGKYKIVILIKKLVGKYNEEEDKTEYEYVLPEEYETYEEPTKLLGVQDFVYKKLESEDDNERYIAKEAMRLYISRLRENEEGKDLPSDDTSVFNREMDRIYQIVYKNFITSKLYQYQITGIQITEDNILNLYRAKILENYERYQEDPDLFGEEVMRSVISSNMYGSYSSTSFNIGDVYYAPEVNEEDSYFTVYHIMVKFSDEQIDRLNEYYSMYKEGIISKEEYKAVLEEEKNNLRLNERDKGGKIIVKSTDENALTFDEMLTNLKNELANAKTDYEKGDIFNDYMYRYTTDTGALQVQKDALGGTHENWFGYTVGASDDGSFLEEFNKQARDLYKNGDGEIGSISDKFFLESWTTENRKDDEGNYMRDENNNYISVKKLSYCGFDVMMYAGKIANPLDCLDKKDFSLESLINEKALYILSLKRLGLTSNKTYFDVLFEEIYQTTYNNVVTNLRERLKTEGIVERKEENYKDLNPFA